MAKNSKTKSSSVLFRELVIPRCRLYWPNLWETDEHGKYSTKLVVDSSNKEALTAIAEAQEDVRAMAIGAGLLDNLTNDEIMRLNADEQLAALQKRANMSFVKNGTYDDWTYGLTCIQARNYEQPYMIDQFGDKLADDEMIYSGAEVIADLLIRDYEYMGKTGITVKLRGLMFCGTGDRERGGKSTSAGAFSKFIQPKAQPQAAPVSKAVSALNEQANSKVRVRPVINFDDIESDYDLDTSGRI
jgi:hypothetical protein